MPREIPVGDDALKIEQQRVWDLPVRLVHWLLAALIGFSWWSVEYHHADWHIWSGIAILALLVFRLLWGLFGSSTARFASFMRGPRAIREDLRGQWSGLGHTPIGGLSVVTLFAAVAFQVVLGLFNEDEDGLYAGPLARLVGIDTGDTIRALHEAWFNVLLGLIVLHVLAIVFYRLVRGKRLTKPMITGKAALDPAAEPIQPGKWWVALLCMATALAVSRWVVAGAPLP